MEYLLHILVITGIYVILTLSLNLSVGFTGLPNLGQAAFSCVGAYVSSLLALHYGLTPWLGLVIGAAAAALLGLLVSFPAIRIKGDYLALATFGCGIIVYSISKNWVSVTRGPMGLPGIQGFALFKWQLSEIWQYLIIVVIFAVLTYFAVRRITNSPFGRVLTGIREDETAALAMGHNINSHKIQVLMTGAFFAGIAGSLYAHYITFIDPSSFTVMESITILLMVVFGGLASLPGSLLGAAALVVLPELLRFLGLPSSVAAPLRQMIYGLLLVLLMLRRPQGLLGKYRWR
jgi:branched-chain amino acid transport system permease protein